MFEEYVPDKGDSLPRIEAMLQTAGEKALHYGRTAGAAVEAYAVHRRELQVEVVAREVETLKEAEDIGLGIRVIRNGRPGFSYTSDLSGHAIQDAVADAVQTASYAQPEDDFSFTPPGLAYPGQGIFDQEVASHSMADKVELACQAEIAARSHDPRITAVERSGYHENVFSVMIMNSKGLYAFDTGSHCGLHVFAIASEDDDRQSGFSSMACRQYHDLKPEETGIEAASRAVRSLKAGNMASGCLPCVLEPYVAVRFLGLLARMVDGDAVQKGRSPLADRLHQPLAIREFSVVDDATREGGIATFPFDDEGIPAQYNTIIEKGILRGFLYDRCTAARAGVHSTGNAQRGSYRSLPVISPNNFAIQKGESDPSQLVYDIPMGLVITDVLGMHTANPISGDFSLGAAGLFIENGVITRPVRGIVVAGNLLELVRQIDAVGNDLRYFSSRGAPTLRVAQLSIAGT